MTQKFKEGDKVNYHELIGGPVTSTGHEITDIEMKPNNFGSDVAWVTGKRGCVALDALTMTCTECDGSGNNPLCSCEPFSNN